MWNSTLSRIVYIVVGTYLLCFGILNLVTISKNEISERQETCKISCGKDGFIEIKFSAFTYECSCLEPYYEDEMVSMMADH